MRLGAALKRLWLAFRAWRGKNRKAHQQASGGACCAAPDAVYAKRHQHGSH